MNRDDAMSILRDERTWWHLIYGDPRWPSFSIRLLPPLEVIAWERCCSLPLSLL